MTGIYDAWAAIEDFMLLGGDVLIAIAAVTFALWTLIIERLLYMRGRHRLVVERVLSTWNARRETQSWQARQIRRSLVSQASASAHRSIGMIQTLVALCPLLGLLGTVTGMIEVFDVMAITGSSNARAMASGVSKATVPTMAGMVAALSGFYPSFRLKQWADDETERINDLLLQRGGDHGSDA